MVHAKFFSKKRFLCLGLTALLMCSGCEKRKDSILDDFSNVSENATNTDSGQEIDYTVPEHIQYTMTGDNTNAIVRINADVVAEGFKEASVYEVTVFDFDEDYIKELATSIFDNGTYKVELPYWVMTKEQLNHIIDEKNSELNQGEADPDGCVLSTYTSTYVQNVEELIDDTQAAEEVEGQMFYSYDDVYYQMEYDHSNGIYKEVGNPISDTMQYARLTGLINDRECQLMVRKSGVTGETRIWIVTDVACSVSDFEFDMNSVAANEMENLCNYEEAEKLAEEMLHKITDTEYELCMANARLAYTESSGVPNGYKFYYTPVVNDIPNVYNAAYTIMDSDQYVDQPLMMIEVDNNGFVQAKYLTDYSVDGCMSDAPALLSFEQCQDELKMNIQTYLERYPKLDISIDRIEFSYMLIRQEHESAIVPVWLYFENTGYQTIKEQAIIGVNALDGSVVVFGNLIDDYYSIIGDR